MRPTSIQTAAHGFTRASMSAPDVVLVDVRDDRNALAAVPALKRRYPLSAVAIVVRSFETDLMLEAMRAGVTEIIVEPLTEDSLRTSLDRMVVPKAAPIDTQLVAILGAKGGVGATPAAVNQELPALRNANPLVRRLQQRYGERVSVLVNRSDRNSEISLDDLTKAVGVPIRHVFPNDYRLATSAANRGQPIALSTQGRL